MRGPVAAVFGVLLVMLQFGAPDDSVFKPVQLAAVPAGERCATARVRVLPGAWCVENPALDALRLTRQ